MAETEARLRLLPLLPTELHPRVVPHDVAAAMEAAHTANNEALEALQNAEVDLRAAAADVLNEGDTIDEYDLGDLLERVARRVPPAPAPETEPMPMQDDSLLILHTARACTQLLADADAADADAARATDLAAQLAGLRRLALLVDEAPHLPATGPMLARTVSALLEKRDVRFHALRKQHEGALRNALAAAHWPPPDLQNPDVRSSGYMFHLDQHDGVVNAWADVCELQLVAASLGLLPHPTSLRASAWAADSARNSIDVPPGSDAYVPLLAVQVLFEPILLRFRYHFDGARSTNRLDKPEWFLSHTLALLQRNAPLFAPAPDAWQAGGDVVELTRRRSTPAPGAPPRQRPVMVDAPAELLHALLLPLRQKICASLPRLVDDPALLAHTISQLLTFDADVPEACPTHGVSLADEVLGNETYFQAWLDGEREFAERRFDALMDSPGAWALVQADTLDDETEALDDAAATVDADTTTRCAASLMRMLAGVTERYQPLASLAQHCVFVIKVQRPLLAHFASHLVRHLDTFENMSSAFSRALPGEIASLSGASINELVRGVNGVTRMAKALLSAQYVKAQLDEWSESSFFLGMAADIAALDRGTPLRRLMSPRGARDVDSASLMSVLQRGLQRGASAAASLRPLARGLDATIPEQDTVPDEQESEAGIWDEWQNKFAAIASRSAHALERLIVSEVLDLLKPYVMRRWDLDALDEADEVPSRELVPALAKLSTLLTQLIQVLPPPLLLPVYRHIATSLSHAAVERIVMPSMYLCAYVLTFRCAPCAALRSVAGTSFPLGCRARLASCRQTSSRTPKNCRPTR